MLDMHRLSLFDQGELWYTPNGKYTVDDFYLGWSNILTVSSSSSSGSSIRDEETGRVLPR